MVLNMFLGVETEGNETKHGTLSAPLPEISNISASSYGHGHYLKCTDGVVVPVWRPLFDVSGGDIFMRGVIYLLALVYVFVGMSIIADRFMAAIEVITSKEKKVVVKKPNGQTQEVHVRIWNETVSNLTLMALGSSAPEILLSVIEVYALDFEAGELGPGTIVGAAAFNIFVIIAVCVWVIPSTEVKKVKELRVVFVTTFWAIFAYIWLYFILSWSSYGVIEVWEAFATLLLFPVTVGTAYMADRRLVLFNCISKKYLLNPRGGQGQSEDPEASNQFIDEESKVFEDNRREFIQIVKDLQAKYPNASMEEIEILASEEMYNRGPKSIAFYRLKAAKKFTRAPSLHKRRVKRAAKINEKKETKKAPNIITFFFDPVYYTVMENVGQFAVTISRDGDLSHEVCVDFCTEDGSATATDYEGVKKTLVFHAGVAHKQVFITVIDDDVFEEDKHFYCHIHDPQYFSAEGQMNAAMNRPVLAVATPPYAKVLILDDDHGGIFAFPEATYEISEAVGEYSLNVSRFCGSRGTVYVPYKTVGDTAKEGEEFEMTEGELCFEDNQTSAEILIQIHDSKSYEKDAVFFVELYEPSKEEGMYREKMAIIYEATVYTFALLNLSHSDLRCEDFDSVKDYEMALLGNPRLGVKSKCEIRIKESLDFKKTVDQLMDDANNPVSFRASSWSDQFMRATTVPSDDGEHKASLSNYIVHFITIFWRIIFAFIPPPNLWGGWPCFVASIVMIGVCTGLVGDLASQFGCTVGLQDSVTAISLVALGTSLPDTFASKVAARHEKYADACIGNVTGSTAVNVFLGIGVAWTLAAVVHWHRGSIFRVNPGSLAFSVTLFCILALVCCLVMMTRRIVNGGELGGPMRFKLPTAILLVSLWLLYVLLSCLEAYGIIKVF